MLMPLGMFFFAQKVLSVMEEVIVRVYFEFPVNE